MHKHHRQRRSQGGTDSPYNIMHVTPEMHDYIHANPSIAYSRGWMVKSWNNPKDVSVSGFELGVDGWHYKHEEMLKSGSVAGEPSETGPEDTGKGAGHQAAAKCPRCRGRGVVEKPPPSPQLPKRKRAMLGIRLPKDADENGIEVLESLLTIARDELQEEMGWTGTVGVYYVLTAVLHDWITSRASATKEA